MIHRGGGQISQERLIILDGRQWYVELFALRLIRIYSLKCPQGDYQLTLALAFFFVFFTGIFHILWRKNPKIIRFELPLVNYLTAVCPNKKINLGKYLFKRKRKDTGTFSVYLTLK